jgi:hypothetical protein
MSSRVRGPESGKQALTPIPAQTEKPKLSLADASVVATEHYSNPPTLGGFGGDFVQGSSLSSPPAEHQGSIASARGPLDRPPHEQLTHRRSTRTLASSIDSVGTVEPEKRSGPLVPSCASSFDKFAETKETYGPTRESDKDSRISSTASLAFAQSMETINRLHGNGFPGS